MKKSSFSLKLIAAIIFFAMGALLILNGLSGFDYSGSYEDQKTYGGDAYTGIQNAAAQGANNINSLAYLIRDIAEVSYLVLGMVLIAVGCYVLARAIDVKSTPSQTPVYKAPDTPDTSSENQTPPTDTQKKEQEPTAVEQPPQQPAYQPPQQPAYQPPQQPAYQPPQQPAYQPPQQPAYQPPQQPAYQPPRQATTTQAAPPQGSRASAELARYQSLLTRGIITQEEFDQKKKQLLG